MRDGLPFSALSRVFAEHFLEHLPYWEAARFLRDCRAALAPDGVLRLSTPNLDWVYATQYERDVAGCFALNKSFRAWGHQFLYNLSTLEGVLREAGFARVESLAYGESAHADLRGLERHERSPDSAELPHVLVVEASGIGGTPPPELRDASRDYLEALGAQ